MCITADALVGAGSNPSVWNSAKSTALKLMMRKGLETRPVEILNGVSGVLKPGRLTLLLGPPGAGKSVLLQHISGRLRMHSGLRASGSVTYNGESINDFVVQRTAGLVDQYDRHVPNLTVIETVKFASNCQTNLDDFATALAAVDKAVAQGHPHDAAADAEEGRAEALSGRRPTLSGLSVDDSDDETNAHTEAEFLELFREAVVHRVKPYITLHLLGLANVADTFVGNESLRGVSGGERKRVTSAEVLVGPQWAVFMDEISTGLDSATTFSVVRALGATCHALERTIVISLLQPPPEVMELFDDLLLMTDGKVIYQ